METLWPCGDEFTTVLWFPHVKRSYLSGGSLKLSSDLIVDFLSRCGHLPHRLPHPQFMRKLIPLQWPVWLWAKRDREWEYCKTVNHWNVQLGEQTVLNRTVYERGSYGVERELDRAGSLSDWQVMTWKHPGPEREQRTASLHWEYSCLELYWPPLVYSYLIRWRSTVKPEGYVVASGSVFSFTFNDIYVTDDEV